MLLLLYSSKKELAAAVGHPLKYRETSFFGPEYLADGKVVGSNRPSITKIKGREFFAEVEMENGVIKRVS